MTPRLRRAVAARRTASTGLALVAAGALLTGCSDGGEEYCQALEDEQTTLTELADSSQAGGEDLLTPTVESFERLRADAPEQLRDEWDTLLVAYRSLVDAVEDSGIDPADYQPDDPPPGLSDAEVERLESVASKVASAPVLAAANGIQQHADEVCDVRFTG